VCILLVFLTCVYHDARFREGKFGVHVLDSQYGTDFCSILCGDFEVLTALHIDITVLVWGKGFWEPCFHHIPEDGSSKFLWDICTHLPNYTGWDPVTPNLNFVLIARNNYTVSIVFSLFIPSQFLFFFLHLLRFTFIHPLALSFLS